MSTIYKKLGLEEDQKRMFLITFPQVLLIVVLLGLLVLLVRTCIQFTKRPLSTTALKQQLLQLQSKFMGSAPINPEAERQEMEILQNKIKTSSDQLTISGDKDYTSCLPAIVSISSQLWLMGILPTGVHG